MTTKATSAFSLLPVVEKASALFGLSSALFGLSPARGKKRTPPPIFLRSVGESPSSTAEYHPPATSIETSAITHSSAALAHISVAPATLRISLDGTGLLSSAWRWVRSKQLAKFRTRRLRVAETVSLGEKRFVAVIQVDGLQYLIGGGATNVALLARLKDPESFSDLLKETMHPGIASVCVPALETTGDRA